MRLSSRPRRGQDPADLAAEAAVQ
ncbi:MAG: hypothetical protein RL223_4869, partial [Pseudomonadota bacterium]